MLEFCTEHIRKHLFSDECSRSWICNTDILPSWFTITWAMICCCLVLVRPPYPDSKVHGANMGPTWILSAPDGPQVGLMNLAIWVGMGEPFIWLTQSWWYITITNHECQSWAYLCNNSSFVQARITKFGLELQNTFVNIPIFVGCLTLTFNIKSNLKSKFHQCLFSSPE